MSFDSASDDAFDSPSLAVLGWDASRVAELALLSSARGVELTPARVARVDRGALTVLAGSPSMRVRPSGRLFDSEFTDGLTEPVGTPAVGDWVALDGPVAVAVLSRRSTFERSSSDRATVAQVVAANVDTVFVVVPLVGRPRPRLLQRCLAMAWQSGATPVVLLTKADIAIDVPQRVSNAHADALGADVFPVSATTGEGLDALTGYLGSGQTIAMIGPSGAGKSTLTNALGAGTFALQTGAVRDDGKGRHTTTARELVVLPTRRGGDRHAGSARPRAVGCRGGHRRRVRRHRRVRRRLPLRRLRASRRARLRGRPGDGRRRSGRRAVRRLREVAA